MTTRQTESSGLGQPVRGNAPAIRRTRWYGWWYITIGIGFILLGFRSYLLGDLAWLTGIRFVIAAGFLVLGRATLKASRPSSLAEVPPNQVSK